MANIASTPNLLSGLIDTDDYVVDVYHEADYTYEGNPANTDIHTVDNAGRTTRRLSPSRTRHLQISL